MHSLLSDCLDHLPDAPALLRVGRSDGSTAVLLWRNRSAIDAGWVSMDSLARMTRDTLRRTVEAVDGPTVDASSVELLAPVESQEVWAAGVTYARSRQARLEESNGDDIYDSVYGAARPELFFKSPGWRVTGAIDHIGIRADAKWSVPEPEVALLANPGGEILAYAPANDVSSRDIEAANPLYLPQAKIYDRSCALGPAAVLAWTCQPDHVHLRIERDGHMAFSGEVHRSQMVRTDQQLIEALQRCYSTPDGVWLLTGTGIVPTAEFSLRPGDVVSVDVDGLGSLKNTVITVGTMSRSE